MSVVVLCFTMVLALSGTIYLSWRGVVHGFIRKRIVVRYVEYTGRKAVGWGVLSLMGSVYFILGMGAVLVLLHRVIRKN